jgi:ornithine carbamoyltransferase
MNAKKPGNENSLLAISDLTKSELTEIISLAKLIKASPEKYEKTLNKKKIALIFQKTSTRTKESFLVGSFELGMFPSYIDWKTSNFTLSALEDEIKVLSQWYDVVMARVHHHSDLATMKAYSSVPIINGLSELFHPCQALADILTIVEEFGDDLSQIKLSYIGDGNNVCNSLIEVAALAGIKQIVVACPKINNYQPLKQSIEFVIRQGVDLTISDDPKLAVQGANVVYTDTWVSMGDEAETADRLRDFAPYQVNEKLISAAAPNYIFLHDMPAHLGQEVTAEIFRGPTSRVFKQADNRKHAQKAVLCKMLAQ